MKEKNNNEYSNSKPKALNSKIQTLTSDRKGITLIALVVTVIVLLILSGVTINMVFSDGGIIKRAQSLKEAQEKAALMEKLELVKFNLEITKRADGKITPNDFFEELKNLGIITDANPGGENIEILPDKDENGNTIYQITTEDDKIIEVVIPEDENEDIKIEYQGKADSLPPKIRIGNITKTTNSIHLEVEVTRIESGDKISYYYKEHTDENYITFKENLEEQTIDIEGLEAGGTYVIKIVATNENGQTQKETQGILLGELPTGTITVKSGPTWVGDGTATLELQTSAAVGYIEYQVVTEGEISGKDDLDDTKWVKYIETITSLEHNNIVFARLTDGVSATDDYLSVEVKDSIEPIVELTLGTVTTKEINVTVISSDSESGMDASPTYSYYIKKSSDTNYLASATASGTFATYKFENLDDGTEYDVKVTVQDRALNEGHNEELKIATSGIDGATEGLTTGTITASTTWQGDGTATVTLTKNVSDESLYIEYQTTKEGTKSGWKTYDGAITGVKHNDLVEARLTDGKNAGNEASIQINDSIVPEIATGLEDATSKTITTDEVITLTIGLSDLQSGINASQSKWVFNTTSTNISATDLVWQNASTFSSGRQIKLSSTTAGTYYLHILSVDNAENKTVTQAGPVTIEKPIVLVESISLDKTELVLGKGGSAILSASVLPVDVSNKKINWTSSDTSVATVDGGVVTVVGGGSTTITAEATDGGGVKATCEITVDAKGPSVDINQGSSDWGRTYTFYVSAEDDESQIKKYVFYVNDEEYETVNTSETTASVYWDGTGVPVPRRWFVIVYDEFDNFTQSNWMYCDPYGVN